MLSLLIMYINLVLDLNQTVLKLLVFLLNSSLTFCFRAFVDVFLILFNKYEFSMLMEDVVRVIKMFLEPTFIFEG